MEIVLPPEFKEFLKLFNSHNCEYLLIGGYAVVYHGYSRPTDDLDIWIARTPENATKIVTALQEFGFAPLGLSEEFLLQEKKIVEPSMRIEILTSISGVDFEECYSERIIDTLDGIEVALISLQHLKKNKRAIGEFKDLDDLEHLP